MTTGKPCLAADCGHQKVVERIRRLECLVQKMGSCGHSRDCLNKSCESSRHQQMPSVAGGTRSLVR